MKYEFEVTSVRTTNSLVTVHATNLKEAEELIDAIPNMSISTEDLPDIPYDVLVLGTDVTMSYTDITKKNANEWNKIS